MDTFLFGVGGLYCCLIPLIREGDLVSLPLFFYFFTIISSVTIQGLRDISILNDIPWT